MAAHTLFGEDRLNHSCEVKWFVLDTERRGKRLGGTGLSGTSRGRRGDFIFMAADAREFFTRHER
jgi:hypothetical protein